jgi:hypothetical protein
MRENPPPPEGLVGALSVDKYTGLPDITDGASNTILLAEIAGRPQAWLGGHNSGQLLPITASVGFGGWGDGSSVAQLFGSSRDGVSSPGPCGINCSNAYGLYSFHMRGICTVFVDGSVHFLDDGISMHDVLIPLLTRSGGEVVPEF